MSEKITPTSEQDKEKDVSRRYLLGMLGSASVLALAKRFSPEQTASKVAGFIAAPERARVEVMPDAQKNTQPEQTGEQIAWLPQEVERWRPQVEIASQEFGIHQDMLFILMTLESKGDPEAVSHAGAQGLLQIMPATEQEIAGRLGESGQDIFDPQTNIRYSAEYLRWLKDNYVPQEVSSSAHQLQLMAIGYNGGLRRIGYTLTTARANGVNLVELNEESPEFRYNRFVPQETRNYASNAFGMWQERNQPQSPTYEQWAR